MTQAGTSAESLAGRVAILHMSPLSQRELIGADSLPFNNVLKRTVKTPKLYFYDTGLICYLTRWSTPEVAESGAMSGALLENFTVSEIVKGYQNIRQEPYIHYYRDKDAKEIDVLLERDGKLFPLEIKKTALPDKRLVRTFHVIDKAPLELGTGAVLCMSDSLGAFDSQNLIVPIWMI